MTTLGWLLSKKADLGDDGKIPYSQVPGTGDSPTGPANLDGGRPDEQFVAADDVDAGGP